MSPSLVSLLAEIDKRTQGRIPDQARRDLLAEIEGHIDAAICARLEMGVEPLEAEKQAITAFGSPREYIQDILQTYARAGKASYTPWRWLSGDRATMLTLVCAIGYFTFAPFSADRDVAMHLLVGGLWVFGLLFVYFSGRARRIQAVPIALALVVGFVFLSLAQSAFWLNLWEHGGSGFVPRREVAMTLRSAQADINAVSPNQPKPRHAGDFLNYGGGPMLSPEAKADRARETISAISAAEAAPLFGDFVANWKSNHDGLAVVIVVCLLLNFVSAVFAMLASLLPWEISRRRRRAG